jgi:hypothetical protein
MRRMQHRTNPILPAGPNLALLPRCEPQLSGQSQQLRPLLDGLDQVVRSEFGAAVPRAAWLRELRLGGGEAVLSLSPSLQRHGRDIAQAAFELLRRELRDTDIYVRAAAH